MARPKRIDVAGHPYHVLNRSNGRMQLFDTQADYAAFNRVLNEAAERFPEMGILTWCVMPNHWHLILWPETDGLLAQFVGWLALTHAKRWHAFRGTTGSGHIYQGRFKSFLIEQDAYLHTACRYVERNPVQARLVNRAEDWAWSGLQNESSATADDDEMTAPFPRRHPGRSNPAGWLAAVNEPIAAREADAIAESTRRGRPYGSPGWQLRVADQFGLESAFRPRGRPTSSGSSASNRRRLRKSESAPRQARSFPTLCTL